MYVQQWWMNVILFLQLFREHSFDWLSSDWPLSILGVTWPIKIWRHHLWVHNCHSHHTAKGMVLWAFYETTGIQSQLFTIDNINLQQLTSFLQNSFSSFMAFQFMKCKFMFFFKCAQTVLVTTRIHLQWNHKILTKLGTPCNLWRLSD